MEKLKNKIENLEVMISNITRKQEKLEMQKKLLQTSLSEAKTKLEIKISNQSNQS